MKQGSLLTNQNSTETERVFWAVAQMVTTLQVGLVGTFFSLEVPALCG